MGVSHLFYARVSETIYLLEFIIASGGLCVLSYLLVVFSPLALLSLVGCALCGLSVGTLWQPLFSPLFLLFAPSFINGK